MIDEKNVTETDRVASVDVYGRARVGGLLTLILGGGLFLYGIAGPHLHGGGGVAHHLTTTFVGVVSVPSGLLVGIKGVSRRPGSSGRRAVWVLLAICSIAWAVRVLIPPWHWT